MALSTAVLIAVTIKSAYLFKSLVDRCPEKSAEPSASSSVDANTSRSVWSNLYLMGSVDVYSYVVLYRLRFQWVGERCPSQHLLETECHVLVDFER